MKLFTPEQTASERITYFADIIIPVSLPQLFTYRVPYELNDFVQVGARVVVPFGKRRVLTGIISKLHQTPPTNYKVKYVLELLEDEPSIYPQQLKLWEWIAEYYICTIGEVMNAALPSGLKLSSTSKIQMNPDFRFNKNDPKLKPKEVQFLQILENAHSLSYEDAAESLKQKSIYNIIKELIEKKAVIIYEEVQEKYRPKTEKRIRLQKKYLTHSALEALFESFAETKTRAKQERLLLKYVSEVPVYQDISSNQKGINRDDLLRSEGKETLSPSSLKTMIKNGIFEEFSEKIPRFKIDKNEVAQSITLADFQEKAVAEVMDYFSEKETVLLHGITGSGKTEIYISLIEQVLGGGSQVLLMLPEIALTTQIVARMKKVFGNRMGIYHSRFSDNERVEVWQGVRDGNIDFVVGVRSAIFLPFDNLGLIIVDEEHDASYKQYDPAPRYNARDLALVQSRIQHAKVLLGSATPSIESYYLAKKGQYGLVSVNQRFGTATLPEIVLVNTKNAKKDNRMRSVFAPELIDAMQRVIAQKEQVILFQNRRGYSPYLSCETCGWIPKCENCAVSLTYHLNNNEVRCHYCGYTQKSPNLCVSCGSSDIKSVGFGTEKIEDDLKLLIPTARILRMDKDTTRSKTAYGRIIESFESGSIDILIGTQMVSKGLDFKNVSLVGVFDTDRTLHFPDFRAFERTFQLVTQVSGRAGRGDKKGLVLIQTANPEQPILGKIVRNDYIDFYLEEIRERESYGYPPFTRLIKIITQHEEQGRSAEAAAALAPLLREKLGESRVLGPQEPIIAKIRNRYLQEIIIKLERNKINLKAVKEFIKSQVEVVAQKKVYQKVRFVIDVDFV
ncbi:MAG: primosomal protein N' [Bernardetiaceae bacterium]|nr:primosomal protein N' [Bernardetiaceae bacterium]